MSIKDTQIFTPRWAADQMLDLISPELFGSDEAFFFEPSCGEGAILIPMLDRIYEAVFQKHQDQNRTVAETLHKFFAVELDESLVLKCREKVWEWVMDRIGNGADYEKLCDYLIANQIRDAIEHNDFFVVMEEGKDGHICRKSKRKSVQELQNQLPEKSVPDKCLP